VTGSNQRLPPFPSFADESSTETLHSNRRSCRWFLSPQPFPGFVAVGVVVVVVEVDVEVLVEVDVDVEVEVVVVVVIVVEYSYSELATALVPKAPKTNPPIKTYAKTATASAVTPGRARTSFRTLRPLTARSSPSQK